MKRIFTILFIGIMVFIGCAKETTGPEFTQPENLKLTVIQKGAGLKLDWDPVKDANAYYVYFGTVPIEDSLHAIYKVIEPNYFIHDSLELECGGYYAVLAVGGEYDSVVGPMSETVRSAPIETKDVILYERDYANGDSSAFGWDMTTGDGFVTSITNATKRWHIYLDDGDSTASDSLYFKFVAPWDSVAMGDSINFNHPPDVPWDSTFITFSTAKYAPLVIEDGFAPDEGGIYKDFVFYLLIDNKYYAKLSVKQVFDNGVKFDAYFQDMENFRRF